MPQAFWSSASNIGPGNIFDKCGSILYNFMNERAVMIVKPEATMSRT